MCTQPFNVSKSSVNRVKHWRVFKLSQSSQEYKSTINLQWLLFSSEILVFSVAVTFIITFKLGKKMSIPVTIRIVSFFVLILNIVWPI